MSKEQFDKVIERRGTNSLKYDMHTLLHKPEDALPMWVADMDFQAPWQVRETLVKVARHGIYGYSDALAGYREAVCGWFETHFQWDVRPEWILTTPGVVFGIALAIRAFTNQGDGVMIQEPVYYPFARSIRRNGRRVVNSPLYFKDGKYQMNFADMEQKIKDEHIKLMIFCSPHNPVGRVWTLEELNKVGELCEKYDVLLVSDEIHCDFTYPGYTHRMIASLSDSLAKRTITCTAPSKTFNLAGLQASNIIISNRELFDMMEEELHKTGYEMLTQPALAACETAYREGEGWLADLKAYLLDNLHFLRSYINEKLPEITLIEPEGTYLVWLDFRKMGMDADTLDAFLLNEAKLWLDNGRIFGEEGEGFARMNIACPRKTLEKGLDLLERTVAARR